VIVIGITKLRAAASPSARAAGARRARLVTETRVQDLVFVAVVVLCVVAHWVVLARGVVPSGLDMGNWLAFGHGLLGEHLRSSQMVYPPLVPLLAAGTEHWLGLMTANHLLTVVSAAAPAAGAYVLLRRAGAGWVAPTLAGLLAAASSTGEAAAWGGYPQLLALGFMGVLLACWDAHLRSGSSRAAVGAALALAGAVASNELVGVACILLVPALVAAHATFRHRELVARWRRHAVGLVVVGLPSLLFAPTYLTLVHSAVETHREYPRPAATLAALVNSTTMLFREFPMFWRIALVLTALAPLALWRHRRHPLWATTTALLVVTLGLLLETREFRYIYLIPVLAVCGVAMWATCARLPRLPATATDWTRGVASLVIAGVLGLQIVTGLSFFSGQVGWYTELTPSFVAAMDWLRTNTPADTLVAVSSSTRNDPLGWWVEGYAQRLTAFESNVAYLLTQDERDRSLAATEIFSARPRLAGVCAAARDHGVSYLLVDKSWADTHGFTTGLTVSPGEKVIMDDGSVLLVGCSA
jgi:hypothetical protein